MLRQRAGPLAAGMAMLALSGMSAEKAQAQAGIVFTGNAQACFYTPPAPCGPFLDNTSFAGLFFTSNSDPVRDFDGTTDASGFVGIGGETNNFGQVFLTHPPDQSYNNLRFDLRLTFSAPPGVSGPALFAATLRGEVLADGNGVAFNFFDNSETLTFDRGQFTVMVNNFSVNANEATQSISGEIQASVIPEPASMILLGTGLAGLVGMRRRRQKNNQDSAVG